jgi:hypothetical protein
MFGVNGQEPQASIDAALTFSILWLEVCRTAQAGKLVVEGLKVFVPSGCSALVRERMAHLNRTAAKWELYELDERAEEIRQIEILDRGNISTRLVHCPNDSVPELVFGFGPAQRVVNDGNLKDFEQLVRRVGEVRHADGPKDSRWWRLHPERWLESLVVKDVAAPCADGNSRRAAGGA